jgi:hypothetical protein
MRCAPLLGGQCSVSGILVVRYHHRAPLGDLQLDQRGLVEILLGLVDQRPDLVSIQPPPLVRVAGKIV